MLNVINGDMTRIDGFQRIMVIIIVIVIVEVVFSSPSIL